MKEITKILVYLGFYSLIGFSLWVTNLWGILFFLVFTPEFKSYNSSDDDGEGDDTNEIKDITGELNKFKNN